MNKRLKDKRVEAGLVKKSENFIKISEKVIVFHISI